MAPVILIAIVKKVFSMGTDFLSGDDGAVLENAAIRGPPSAIVIEIPRPCPRGRTTRRAVNVYPPPSKTQIVVIVSMLRARRHAVIDANNITRSV
jgi:hypothetical protein